MADRRGNRARQQSIRRKVEQGQPTQQSDLRRNRTTDLILFHAQVRQLWQLANHGRDRTIQSQWIHETVCQWFSLFLLSLLFSTTSQLDHIAHGITTNVVSSTQPARYESCTQHPTATGTIENIHKSHMLCHDLSVDQRRQQKDKHQRHLWLLLGLVVISTLLL